MKSRRLAGSLPFLLAITALLVGAETAAIFPASTFIIEHSTSITDNFYIVGSLMALVLLASAVQALLMIRIVWGPAAMFSAPTKEKTADDDVDRAELQAMRATGTKKALVLFVLIAANTTIFDQLGRGILISDTRAVRVITLLRSEDGQDRADAVHDSIMLTGNDRIRRALKRVIEEPGEAREWAVYAAGVRHDDSLGDSILNLLETGSARERASSALALARLKDDRLIRVTPGVFVHLGELKGDYIKALGTLGKRTATTKEDLKIAGKMLSDLLLSGNLDDKLNQLIIWALGRFDAPEGLLQLETLIKSPCDLGTLCIGLEALGSIGSASTSPILIELIYKSDKAATCPELVYADFTGHEALLSTRVNLIERILYEIAHIGDRRARQEMDKLAQDKSFSKTVRNLAGEIAFQMKYKPISK